MYKKEVNPFRRIELRREIRLLIARNKHLGLEIRKQMEEVLRNCGLLYAKALEIEGIAITKQTEKAIIKKVRSTARWELELPYGPSPGEHIPELPLSVLIEPLPAEVKIGLIDESE